MLQSTYKFLSSLFFFFLLIFQHVALFSCFLLFFPFFPRRSVPLIVACLFLFFLSTSFNSSIFLCPFRWCRVVMFKTAVYGNQVRFESFKNSLTLLQGFERVVQGFACESVLETEHKLHILTPLLWPSRCVFLVLLLFNRRHRAHSIGGFREPPRSGVAFPTTSGLYCLEFYWQLLWHPELNWVK